MTDTTNLCPYCPRQFGSASALRDHLKAKRRSSAAHGLTENGVPRSRDAIEEAAVSATCQRVSAVRDSFIDASYAQDPKPAN